MSETPADDTPPEPITVSAVFQMKPLWRPGREGEASVTDLGLYADQFLRWMTDPLGRFADFRGGDLFASVVVSKGSEHAGREYRDGKFTEVRQHEDAITPSSPAPGQESSDG